MNALKISRRLGLGFGLVLLLAAFILGIGLWRLDRTANETQAMMATPLAKERLASDWYAVIVGGSRRTMAIARSSDASLVTFFADDAVQATKASTEAQNGIEALLSTPAERELFAKIAETRKQYIAQRNLISQLKKEGREAEALATLEQTFKPLSTAYIAGLKDLQDLQRQEIDRLSRTLKEHNQVGMWLLLAFGITTLLVGVAVSWAISRSIVGPLQTAVAAARRVADGDLTVELPRGGTDETGQLLTSLSDMQRQLAAVVLRVRDNAHSVATASAEIAQGNNDLSQRTEHQAASLQETAASMDELSATVGNNADNAAEANAQAGGAAKLAARGGEAVQQVVQTMGAISLSSRRISDIIGTIDGIAFQTNILALNAAVEAARAGEQGRGFAVVASEVRTLAQRSASAAREIKTLIGSSVEQVEQGARQVELAGATMQDIVAAIGRVRDIVAEISTASAEQRDGVRQVGSAVTAMDQATQQNAALVEESAAAAMSLQTQSQQLVEVVALFKLAHAR